MIVLDDDESVSDELDASDSIPLQPVLWQTIAWALKH